MYQLPWRRTNMSAGFAQKLVEVDIRAINILENPWSHASGRSRRLRNS